MWRSTQISSNGLLRFGGLCNCVLPLYIFFPLFFLFCSPTPFTASYRKGKASLVPACRLGKRRAQVVRLFRPAPPTASNQRVIITLGQRPADSGHHSEAAALPFSMSYARVAVLGEGGSGRPGQARAAVGDSTGPVARTAGLPDPASLSRSQAVMVQDQRLPRVPAEPGTIPRLCARLLGAGETKRKCQERVNQTRYSVTITSLSGLLGPCAPRAQAGHLRGAHSQY